MMKAKEAQSLISIAAKPHVPHRHADVERQCQQPTQVRFYCAPICQLSRIVQDDAIGEDVSIPCACLFGPMHVCTGKRENTSEAKSATVSHREPAAMQTRQMLVPFRRADSRDPAAILRVWHVSHSAISACQTEKQTTDSSAANLSCSASTRLSKHSTTRARST